MGHIELIFVVIKEFDVLAATSLVQTFDRVGELVLDAFALVNGRAHGVLGLAGSSRYTANLFRTLRFLVHHSRNVLVFHGVIRRLRVLFYFGFFARLVE